MNSTASCAIVNQCLNAGRFLLHRGLARIAKIKSWQPRQLPQFSQNGKKTLHCHGKEQRSIDNVIFAADVGVISNGNGSNGNGKSNLCQKRHQSLEKLVARQSNCRLGCHPPARAGCVGSRSHHHCLPHCHHLIQWFLWPASFSCALRIRGCVEWPWPWPSCRSHPSCRSKLVPSCCCCVVPCDWPSFDQIDAAVVVDACFNGS